jgi:diguanylate cyclase (GGDEF)-like protein
MTTAYVDEQLNNKEQTEKRLRNIFIGCLVLLVLIVLVLSYLSQGPEGWNVARLALFPTLLWALVVTTYAFYSLLDLARRRRQALETLSTHDHVTGAYSYSYVASRVQDPAGAESGEPRQFGFGYIRLSGLQQVNEEFGHAVGNVVLRGLATQMMEAAPDSACLGRLAGQEFCILAPPAAGSVEPLTRRMAAICNGYDLDLGARGHIHSLSAIYGTAKRPSDGSDLDSLVASARIDAVDRVAHAAGQ